MNRTFALWLLRNPLAAVLLIALLPLQPLFGLLCFVPGAICALYVLEKGDRAGALVALGAVPLMALSSTILGRPIWMGLVLAVWPLLPGLLLASLLRRSQSLSMVLQVAVLCSVALLAVLHVAVGDPLQFAWMRDQAQTAQQDLPNGLVDDELVTQLARTFWGWATALTMLMAMSGVFLARWWQSEVREPGVFGREYRTLRLGRVLGAGAAVTLAAALATKSTTLSDMTEPFVVALILVGLAAAHRAAAGSGFGAGWLWLVYVALVLPITMPFTVMLLVGWGFVDNWRRSRPTAPAA